MQQMWISTRDKVQQLSSAVVGGAENGETLHSVIPVAPNRPPANIAAKGRGNGRSYSRNTTHYPALLDEINDMISLGLKAIDAERLKCKELVGEPETPVENDREALGTFQSDRLAVYRTAFQRYIDGSSIYKSFLNTFLYEYDTCVSSLREQVRQLSSVRLEIPLQEIQTTNRIREIGAEHSQRSEEYLRRICQLEGALAASERKLTMTLSEFQRYKDSSEKMRSQWEEMRVSCMRLTSSLSRHEEDSKRNKALDAARQAEFVVAKVNEKKAMEQSERLTVMLQEMEAVQSTLVTKEAVEEQLATITGLRSDLKKNEDVHRDLINRYSTLKAALEQAYVSAQVPTGSTNVNNKRPGSGMEVEGIGQLTKDNIRSAVEKLLDQVKDLKVSLAITESQIASDDSHKVQLDDANATSGEQFSSPWSHFEGLGMHPSIPPYLRVVGKVQNFFMSRRDTAKLLKEIMGACEAAELQRIALEQEQQSNNPIPSVGSVKGVSEPFSSFFFKYLTTRSNGSSSKAMEVAYNLVDCLKKYSQESDCRLFALILDDVLPAEAWFDLHKTLTSFHAILRAEESRTLGQKLPKSTSSYTATAAFAAASSSRKLSIEVILRLLKKTFPNKTDQAVARVSRALVLETNINRLVDLDRCLLEHDFTWSFVSEELRQQYINEVIDFTDTITENVSKCREMPSDTTSTVADLRAALVQAAPNKPRSEINEYLTRGCGVSLEQMLIIEAKHTEIKLESFLYRLKRGLLRK